MKLIQGVAVLGLIVPGAPSFAQKQSPESDALAAACGQTDPNRPMSDLSPAESRAFIICLQRNAVADFRRRLPTRVDDSTTLMDVTVEGAIAIYHMKVDVDVALVPMSAITSLKQATREHACSDTGMNNTIALGGGYRYIWTDKNGAVIGETTIDSC